MPIPISCPGCAARLNAPDGAAGKTVKCPRCKAAVAVPAPLPPDPGFEVVEDEPPAPEPPKKKPVVAAVEDDAEDARPRKKPRADDAPPARKRPTRHDDDDDDDEDDEDDDRPRRKRRAAANGGSSKVLVAAVAGVLLLAGGFAVYWFALREAPTETAGTGTGTPPGPTDPKDPKNPTDPKDPKGESAKSNVPIWAEFSSARFAFKTSFPWRTPGEFPLPGPFPAAVDSGETRSFTVARQLGGRFIDAAGVSVLRFRRKTSEAERQKAGDDYFKGIPIPPGGKRSEAKATTLAGRPAKEFVTESTEDGRAVRAHARLVVTETSIYVVTVRDVGGFTPADVAKFFDGFELLPDSGPKPPDPKTEPRPTPPSLPPTPAGWVKFTGFGQRYLGQIPPGSQPVATGRLAYVRDVGKGKIGPGHYDEVAYKDRGVTLTIRVLDFARETTPDERAALLEAYAERLAGADGGTPTRSKVKWGNLEATEEVLGAPEFSQVRRYAVAGNNGVVLTVRGTKRAEFDEWKSLLFDHVLPNPLGGAVSVSLLQKGWEELSSDAGLFRVEMPGAPVPADDVNKILADLKVTGEFHRVANAGDAPAEYVAGYVRFPGTHAAADRKRVRDQLLAALKPVGAADKKPVSYPGKPPRQLPWEEFQWLGRSEPVGGFVRFHESDNILRVLAARGKGVRDSQDYVRFTQFFELLR